MNSGYIGKQMSKRAAAAYARGLVTRSKLSNGLLKSYGIGTSSNMLKWMMKKGYVMETEWHHVGKLLDRVSFYDLNDVKEQLERLDMWEMHRLYERRNEEGGFHAFAKWEEAGRTEKGYVFVHGGFAYVDENKRRNINAKAFEVLRVYHERPKGMSEERERKILEKVRV